MTASPPLNGHQRPAMPVLGDWRPVTETPKPDVPETPTEPEPVAQARAEAVRAQAWAAAEAQRIAAEAAAKTELIKAAEEARKLKLANDRAERKAEEEAAASRARIAEHNRRCDDAERARATAAEKADAERAAAQQAAQEAADADDQWRRYAIGFAAVSGIVSLPVQMSFFWNPHAPWMAAAPVMLEGAAWVVHRGAKAAAVSRRPVWHYRTIVWVLALIAAAINLYHGLHAFDPGTAAGTAFASIAGPGVWDLYEHGRIRRRDGVPTRRERRAQEKAAREETRRREADEARRRAEKEAAEAAAIEAAQQLAAARAEQFPRVWERAVKTSAAVGESTVTEAVWRRAYRDIEGTDPGESAETIRARNAAERRVEAARGNQPVNGSSPQVASQVLGAKSPRVYHPPARRGVRAKGDTPEYSPAARKQASIAATNARRKDQR